jgi:acyl transferase domain-containing protein/acyl carrier protein
MADSTKLLDRALVAIKKLEAKLQALETARTEPIAIIGVACRFPAGANSPEEYWNLLNEAKDGISEIPSGRWPSYLPQLDLNDEKYRGARWAGLLDDIEGFDASFFGISPREAARMDPQQRLALEVSWEALENAGIVAERMLGSDTGIYFGAVSLDYRDRMVPIAGAELGPYAATGNLLSVVAGRMAHFLGTEGPCVTVETACSSSLVAVHLACQSLRARECSLALSGGVNLLVSPVNAAMLAEARSLSSDGRCKVFDASADGLVRGEGCGVVVLKRLSDALRDKDPIWATIRGSAVNQDGRSTGLTTPNVVSQQKLLRQALANAGVSPADVSCIEAHGTGTPLGDPIEVEALSAVLGQPRANGLPCFLGSVKANIGHLESAAGIAGLIKVLLALRHRTIPQLLHFTSQNPRFALGGTPFKIPTQAEPWLPGAQPRIAGVSSFGVSGTNAHVVIEEAPKPESGGSKSAECAPGVPFVLPLSAKSEAAVRQLAAAHATSLRSGPLAATSFADFAASAVYCRSHHEHRVAVVAADAAEAAELLSAFAAGDRERAVFGCAKGGRRKRPVFVFPGYGSQWQGMARDLSAWAPAFRESMQAIEQEIGKFAGWSLMDRLASDEPYTRTERVTVVPPLLFAVGVSLAAQWRAWGVLPGAVVGHSMGEIAAAHVAGALELSDAVRLICRRSELLARLIGDGVMALVELPDAEVRAQLQGEIGDSLWIAGNNSPRLTVLSGNQARLEALVAAWTEAGVFSRVIEHSVPSHGPGVDGLLDDARELLGGVRAGAGQTRIYSSVTGAMRDGAELDTSYWLENLRQPVRFHQAIGAAIAAGHDCFIEMSAHPILKSAVDETLRAAGKPGVVVPSLRRGADGPRALLRSLGELHCLGISPSWETLVDLPRARASLPSYAWQRERHWSNFEAPVGARKPAATGGDLVGARSVEESSDAWPAGLSKELFHQVCWQPSQLAARQAAPGCRLLVLSDGGSVASATVESLRASGHDVVVWPDRAFEGTDAAALAAAFERDFGPKRPCDGILYLWALGVGAESLDVSPRGEALSWLGALHLVQAITASGSRTAPRLWLVTQGAQAVGADCTLGGLLQSPLWGMGQVLAYEHPELCCVRLDLCERLSPLAAAAALCAEVSEDGSESQVAVRLEARYVARLIRQAPSVVARRTAGVRARSGSEAPAVCVSDGSYLVTGGLGGLGLTFAEWLADQGARALILVGRTGVRTSAQREAVESLRKRGVDVEVVAADISDPQSLGQALEAPRRRMPAMRGVLHAAGLLRDGFIAQQTAETYRDVMASKVAGSLSLHRLTLNDPLDFFVLFSSASAIVGSPGQSNYAAASAFLDAFAHYRVARGLPALSVDWGAFADVGGAATESNRGARLEARGMSSLAVKDGLGALQLLLGSDEPRWVVTPFNTRQWLSFYPQLAATHYFDALLDGPAVAAGPSAFLEQLKRKPPQVRKGLIAEFVRTQAATVLQQQLSNIGLSTPFTDLGMDSLAALEFRNRLEASFDVKLPAAMVWTYTSVAAVADHLMTTTEPTALEPKAPALATEKPVPGLSDDEVVARLRQAVGAQET